MKDNYTIVVFGHKNHGKSSFVRALRGADSESESAPLISYVTYKGVNLAFIDTPGSRRFLKNSIRWVLQADYVVLAVAADDGVMPQTEEFIKIVGFSGVNKGVIVLTKTDSVDSDLCELAELEVEEAVQDTVFEGKDIVKFSSSDPENTAPLLSGIVSELKKAPEENINGPMRFFIDNRMSVPGFGTVVTGRVLAGTISKDEILYLSCGNHKTRVRSIEVNKNKKENAFSGERAGICLSGVQFSEVKTGMAILKKPHSDKKVFLNTETILTGEIKNRQRVKFFHGTSCHKAFITILKRYDKKAVIQFRFEDHIHAAPKDRFIISPLNSQVVTGGGRVLEVSCEKYRESKRDRILPYLEKIIENDVKEAVFNFLKRNFLSMVSIDEIVSYGIFPEDQIKKAISELFLEKTIIEKKEGNKSLYYLKENYDYFLLKIVKITEEYFSANPLQDRINFNEISARLNDKFDSVLLKDMLSELVSTKKIRKSSSGFSPVKKIDKLTTDLEKLNNLIVNHAKSKGFLTFSLGSFCRENSVGNKSDVQKLLERLERQKILIKLNNDNFLLREVIGDIKDRVEEAIKKKGKINLTHSMEIVGYGRAKAAPLFEYLDDIGFTRRDGNERFLKK